MPGWALGGEKPRGCPPIGGLRPWGWVWVANGFVLRGQCAALRPLRRLTRRGGGLSGDKEDNALSIKQKGGTVNNPANTAISGYTYGVEIYGAAGMVTNSGMITSNSVSTGFGVYLQDGGTVTNSGVIFGGGPKGQGVKLLSGKVTNESRGVIQGFTYAVDMGGGTVTNNAGGSIVAAEVGVAFQLNAGSLTNAGVINVQPVVQSTSVFESWRS